MAGNHPGSTRNTARGPSCRMRRTAFALLIATALLRCDELRAAQQAITWADAMSCEYEVRFDPAKYNPTRVQNTIELLFDHDRLFLFSTKAFYPELGQANIERHQQECSRGLTRLVTLPVIDLPGIERYRRVKLEQLTEECDFDTLSLRAQLGDAAALREYTRSVARCSQYIDALEGKVDISAAWRAVVNATCKSHGDQAAACKASFFAAEGKPDAEARTRSDVLAYGWTHCSVPYLKVNVELKSTYAMQDSLQRRFGRLFKIRRSPCSDP